MLYGARTTQELCRRWLDDQRKYAARMIRESLRANSDGALFVKGFVIHVGRHCTHAAHLQGTFIPIDKAARSPTLLPPYKGCDFETCECYFDEVLEGDRMPRSRRKAVQKLERRVHRGASRRKILRKLLWVGILIALAWWWLHKV